MAHPDGLLGREVVEELRTGGLEVGLAELRCARALDRAAEVARHELHPVTDPQRRDAEIEDLRVEVGRAVGVDRRRPAGENERRRIARGDLGGGEPMPDQLRVDTRLAHPPRDQLAVLPAEVDDEDGAVFRDGLRGRDGDDLRHLSAGSWERPS